MDFQSLGLAPRLTARLAEGGLVTPTPIQAQAIPHALAGRDVIGLAQTGTGKTAAFGLPLVHALGKTGVRPEPKRPVGLVLAPTRELAKQIADTLGDFTRGSHLRVSLVVGGASMNRQADTLRKGVDLLVATPGRLIDLIERKALSLDDTRFLVLDEADQMLDMGFIHALRRIARLLPARRQTMLFSATMPRQIEELSRGYQTDPVRIEVARPGLAVDRIDQWVHFVAQPEKLALLKTMLADHPGERSLVFARTKHGAERIMKQLAKAGFAAGSIHGNKSQGQRERTIAAFRKGTTKVLVATDVAARGLDIEGVGHVYNYDLPNVAENYVHRIGRTARAGADGRAVAFCSADESAALKDIQKLLKASIPVGGGQPWHPLAANSGKPRAARPARPRRNRSRTKMRAAA
ncbi:DEAD/DEAH box helicase [Roseitalea sp. MMSF_3504]|nr:DEAD/DEAH box helicase [Roseitalea sp. MMSF_3504]